MNRPLPQAVEVEKNVLGVMLTNKECCAEAFSIITTNDFYNPTNQKIFEAMKRLEEKCEGIDAVTVVNELREMGRLHTKDDPPYITGLSLNVASTHNVKEYSLIIKDKSIARGIIQECNNAINRAFVETEDVFENLQSLEGGLVKLSTGLFKKEPRHVRHGIQDLLHNMEKIRNGSIRYLGLETGYRELDFLFSGLDPEL